MSEKEGSPPLQHRRRATLVRLSLSYLLLVTNVVYAVALIPIYLRFFDLGAYGAWLASGNVLRILGSVDAGLTTVLSQRLAQLAGAHENARFVGVTGSGLVLAGLAALVLAAGGYTLAVPVAVWVNAASGDNLVLVMAIRLAALGAGMTLVSESIFCVTQAWQRPLVPGLTRILAQAVNIAVTLALLFNGWHLAALGAGLAASAMVSLFVAAVSVGIAWRRMDLGPPVPRRHEFTGLLATTLPLAAGRTASTVLGNAESFLAAVLVSPAAAAVLAITGRAFQLGSSLLNPISGSVFQSLAHFAGSQSGRAAKSVVAEILGWSAVLTAVVMPIVLALNEGFVALWVGADKFGGQTMNLVLFAGSVLLVRLNLLGTLVPALGLLQKPAWCTVAELTLRIPVLLLLVDWLGVIGVPLSAVISGLAVSLWYLSGLLHEAVGATLREGLRIDVRGGALLMTTAIVGATAASALPLAPSWLMFAVSALAVALAIGAVFLVVDREAPGAALRLVRKALATA